MSEIVIYSIVSVSSLGILAAVILYLVARRFKVIEDPRIDDVEEALPSANCGGCGFPGCRNFAEACVKANSLDDLYCPVGGNDCMNEIAKILGKTAAEKDPEIAVLRCNGMKENRPKTTIYDGAATCTIVSNLYTGENGCQYGCLGLGECVEACTFDALYMDESTGLPVVDPEKCTACGDCVKACPRDLFELRKRGKRDRRIYVACTNEDKGGIAKKNCTAACIGCGKCVKECPFEGAITMKNNLAYIDPNICKLCRKCVDVCPTGAILAINFPPKKKRPAKPKTTTTTSKTSETKTLQEQDKQTKEKQHATVEQDTENNKTLKNNDNKASDNNKPAQEDKENSG